MFANPSRLTRSRAVQAVVVAILSAGVASVVTAAASDDPNVIHGCVSNRSGALRIVQSAADCTAKETAISWNKEGPQGAQGEPGISPAAGSSCPAGDFVTGIATDGTLVCGAASGDDGGGGGGGDTEPTDGDNDGYATDTDCNDNDPAVYPGAVETIDGKDNNCDGTVDETSDLDGDSFEAPEDCNDADATVYPGSPHEIDGDGKDSNCDGVDAVDLDQDGYEGGIDPEDDCDDDDPTVHPDAVEVQDGKDNDCDGLVDELPE